MSLQELENDGKLIPIKEVTLDDVKAKYESAFKFYNEAIKNLQHGGDATTNYTLIYDAIRMAGEALIKLHGYKVKGGKSNHIITFDAVKEIVRTNGEFEILMLRIEKMRSKRHGIEYRALEISEEDIKTAQKDAYKFFLIVKSYIQRKSNQRILL